MKKPFWLSLLLILVLSVACAQPTAAPQAKEVVKETVVVEKPVEKVVKETVVVEKEVPAAIVEARLSGWTASPEEENLLRALLYDCTIQRPDVRVKYEPIPSEVAWDRKLCQGPATPGFLPLRRAQHHQVFGRGSSDADGA